MISNVVLRNEPVSRKHCALRCRLSKKNVSGDLRLRLLYVKVKNVSKTNLVLF